MKDAAGEVLSVGKAASIHALAQEEINALLVAKAREATVMESARRGHLAHT